jgi:putative transposase
VWRICRDNGWWSVFGKKKTKKSKPGAPAHDDLVKRDFTAAGPDELWLTDITEHWTREGKLYLCAIKDVWSNRIVGYSIDSRMKARLAVNAIDNAVARRGGDVAGCILHSDRGSQFRSRKAQRALVRHGMVGSAKSAQPATTLQWNRSSHCCRRTSSTGAPGRPATSFGSRSSTGSNAPITGADDSPASAG